MLTERQSDILNKLIQEYINFAKPVSSQLLEKKCAFGICPATLRIEMKKLTDEGFLIQPHTSSGRVPTDKGYRFFVDDLLRKEASDFKEVFETEEQVFISEFLKFKNKEALRDEKEDIIKLASHLTKFLARLSSNFVILHLLERDFLLKEGWEEILKEPEFDEKELIFEFTNFLKNLEEDNETLNLNSGIKIYIGKENPFTKAEDFSIIFSKCYFPDEEEGTISLLGPKRMNYNRNISLMNSLTKLLEEL